MQSDAEGVFLSAFLCNIHCSQRTETEVLQAPVIPLYTATHPRIPVLIVLLGVSWPSNIGKTGFASSSGTRIHSSVLMSESQPTGERCTEEARYGGSVG